MPGADNLKMVIRQHLSARMAIAPSVSPFPRCLRQLFPLISAAEGDSAQEDSSSIGAGQIDF